MAQLKITSLERPEETRKFKAHGYAEFVELGDRVLSRGTFEPGWRWTQDVAPVMKLDLCPVHHQGVVLSGRMHISYPDGTEADIGPGDTFDAEGGHDAWVLGDDPCVVLDFSPDASRYAAPKS